MEELQQSYLICVFCCKKINDFIIYAASNPDDTIEDAAMVSTNIDDSYSHDVPKKPDGVMLAQDDNSDSQSVVIDQQDALNDV